MNNAVTGTAAPAIASAMARGVCRLLADMGYGALCEFRLASRRRVDVIGLDKKGRFAIVEIKTSAADLRADGKWPEYRPYCDVFYFAVADGFPFDLLPDGCGVIAADAYGGTVLGEAPETPMNASRRRAQLLRFALTAAARLQGLLDPRP